MSDEETRPRLRWLQFSLRGLFLFVTGVGVGLFTGWWVYLDPDHSLRQRRTSQVEDAPDARLMSYLLANRSTDARCQSLYDNLAVPRYTPNQTTPPPVDLTQRRLVHHSRYSTGANQRRLVFVYDPPVSDGSQLIVIDTGFPEYLVITDDRYRLLSWKQVGGNGSFESAEFGFANKTNPILAITRDRSGIGGGSYTYRYSLAGDQIQQVGRARRRKKFIDYEEKLQEWMASSKGVADLIWWAHGCDATVYVRKDGEEDGLDEGDPLPEAPFGLSIGFHRDDKDCPLDITPLRNVENLYELSVGGEAVDDRVMPIISSLSGLEELNIDATLISSKGLSRLDGTQLPNLRSLSLSGAAVNGRVLKQVGTFLGLEFLELRSDTISDQDLPALSPLQRLRFLDLTMSGNVTGSNLPVLRSLRALWWFRGGITNEGLAHVAKQPSLYGLRIHGCKEITDAGLESLAGAKALGRLSIESTNLTGTGFRAFAAEHSLHWVNADKSKFSDKGLAAIGRLKNLKALSVSATAVTSAGVKHLSTSTSLEHLVLWKTKIDDDAIPHLSKIKTLKQLGIRGTNVTEQGKTALMSAIAGLEVEKVYGLHDFFLARGLDLGDEEE